METTEETDMKLEEFAFSLFDITEKKSLDSMPPKDREALYYTLLAALRRVKGENQWAE